MRKLHKRLSMWVGLLGIACLGIAVEASATAASIKSMGMGGAAVAFPQDSLASVYNPAASAFVGCRLDLGVAADYWHKTLTISDRGPVTPFPPPFIPQEGHFTTRNNVKGFPVAGLNLALPCHFSLGFALWNNYHFSTHYKEAIQDFSGPTQVGNPSAIARFDYRVDALSATLAYRFFDCHAIGVSANFFGAWMKIDGLQAIQAFSLEPGRVTGQDWDASCGVGATIGYLGHFCGCFSLGAAYSPRVRMHHFDRYEGFEVDRHFDLPSVWRLGAAYDCLPCLTVAIDWEYIRWKDVKTWRNPFPATSTVVLPPNAVWGTRDGPGFGWRNEWLIKVGVDYQIACDWVVRFGYRYDRNPLRNDRDTTLQNFLTMQTVQNYLSLGATWQNCCCYGGELSGFVEYGFRSKIKSIEPQIGPTTAPSFTIGAYQFASSTCSFGLSYGVAF